MNTEKNEFYDKITNKIIYNSSECFIYFKDGSSLLILVDEDTDDSYTYPILNYKYESKDNYIVTNNIDKTNEFGNKIVDKIVKDSNECFIYFKDNTKFSVFARDGMDDSSIYPVLEYEY